MTVDEYKKKYGSECFNGFLNVGKVVHLPEIPVTLYDIILETISKINEMYIPYTVSWVVQKRPKVWSQILEIEDEMKVAVLCDDESQLRESLKMYYEIWVDMIVEFEAIGRKFVPF